ncbi:unnamed protein product [Moneuplotes crassus]|uniref:Aminopeptidase n=1 Tax=Euplotes crassus TaxID=5936 RepID=A0AAD1XS67_EUPCR|nr:unnamed protein product [Moneuplotes crassus]
MDIEEPKKVRLYPQENGVHAIRPRKYHLRIMPKINEILRFSAILRMEIEVSQDGLDEVYIHSKNLQYSSIKLLTSDGEIPGEIFEADDYEKFTYKCSFFTSEAGERYIFEKGSYTILFEYEGDIVEKDSGFYACVDPRFTKKHFNSQSMTFTRAYIECESNEELKESLIENSVVCSTLEPVECRSIMPCFDEPVHKAIFSVEVMVYNKHHIAISNSPVAQIEEIEEGRLYKFEDTPLMSTYLLCIIVGKFDYLEDTIEDRISTRVYTPSGLAELGRFFLEMATKALRFYEDYFDIKYPLKKLDLVSLHSMHVRAMENWGCITFFCENFLMDLQSESSKTVIRSSRTICHEISHMWFGNLVTMEWWTDIWLNEGFARFMEFLALDEIHPEFHVWDQFINDVFTSGISQDRGYRSHPIEINCKSPDDIDSIFDSISYAKGSAIIRMINAVMGEKNFQQCISKYLSLYKYKNTRTKDLWKVLEDGSSGSDGQTSQDSKVDVSFMDQWTKTKGFPIISIIREISDENSQKFTVIQKSCHRNDIENLWKIPLNYITSSGITGDLILTERMEVITLPIPESDIIKFNHNSTTFCLIDYDPDYQESLLNASATLSIHNRLGLIEELSLIYKQKDRSSLNKYCVEMLKSIYETSFSEQASNYYLYNSLCSMLGVSLLNDYIPLIALQNNESNESFNSQIHIEKRLNFFQKHFAELFHSCDGFNTNETEYLKCQLIGTLAPWLLFITKDQTAIDQCKEILLRVIEKIVTSDPSKYVNEFITSIQSDIRPCVYIGGILSKDETIEKALISYYKNHRETLMDKGYFTELNSLCIALLFCSGQESLKIRSSVIKDVDINEASLITYIHISKHILNDFVDKTFRHEATFKDIEIQTRNFLVVSNKLNVNFSYTPEPLEYFTQITDKYQERKEEIDEKVEFSLEGTQQLCYDLSNANAQRKYNSERAMPEIIELSDFIE